MPDMTGKLGLTVVWKERASRVWEMWDTILQFFQDAGSKITALAEYEGAIFNEDGLDVSSI
jgi:glutamate dehydrogenase (NAD(P)+)